MSQEAIQSLDDAIANHPFRPKGMMTSVDLFDVLKANGRIERKEGMWYFDSDIFVSIDNESDGLSFDLPSSQ